MFNFTQNVFDSREILEAIEELETLETIALDPEATPEDIQEFSSEDMTELARLREFESLANWVEDWKYGETFIHERYFTEYAKDLVTDCYSITAPDWVEIDWESTAKNLQDDYSSVDFEGETFYVRG